MRLEILDVRRRQLLAALPGAVDLTGFYLAGGTALSLQLGLRVSQDFDFFTPYPFNEEALADHVIKSWPQTQRLYVGADTCNLLLDGIQLSFFRYPYPLVAEPVREEETLPGIDLARPDDIAAMKWSAIGGRGSRKDFYDLYQIYQTVPGFDSQRLFDIARAKFGDNYNYAYMIMGMSYFEDAEDDVLPKVFLPADWQEIKRFFRQEQAVLLRRAQARNAGDDII